MTPSADVAQEQAVALIRLCACLLYANGQTTRRVADDIARLGGAIGYSVAVFPNWSDLTIRLSPSNGPAADTLLVLPVAPTAVDMNKVARTQGVIDAVCAGRLGVGRAVETLGEIEKLAPSSTLRFSVMAGIGAAALGVIFGGTEIVSLALIALSAGVGAWLRRMIALRGGSILLQPLSAALLAGLVGAASAAGIAPATDAYLIALCPCMVLMPGPHFLNAALDLAHVRIALGRARLDYALLLTLMICVGLIAGLSLGHRTLPPPAVTGPTPLAFDVLAAGLAVAAYGTFFSMPWRMLTIPVAIGMFAHACRWVALEHGVSAPLGAFIACLIVGLLVTPVTNRLRLPFAGFAFASVVSLIPGAYMFRMAAGLVAVTEAGTDGNIQLLMPPFVEGVTAGAILLAMALGLVLPKLLLERLAPVLAGMTDASASA